ncbi:MAG: hypothetical protein Q7R84_02855 [bacterium]|nr:hypothetical protein [bacterium]
MSLESFLRFLWSPAIWLLLGIGIVWFMVWIIRQIVPKAEAEARKWLNKGGFIISVILLAIFIFSAINAASVNVFPRFELDRSGVDQQSQEWQDQHSGK